MRLAALHGSTTGVKVRFDIDGGYTLGDSVLWVSALNLYELVAPLDPAQPTLPKRLAQSAFFNDRDPGSNWFYDAVLSADIKVAGTYYIEVTAAYPYGIDGVPKGDTVRIPVGSAVSGTPIRDASGFMTFSDFPGQTDFQNVANELKLKIAADVVGPLDPSSLKGKNVTVVGAFSTGGPANAFLVQPASIEVAP